MTYKEFIDDINKYLHEADAEVYLASGWRRGKIQKRN